MEITTFAVVQNPRYAQAFIDYMKSQGITVKMQQGEQQSIELLCLSEQAHVVEPEWQAFMQSPNDDKYLSASWDVGTTEPGFRYATGESIWQRIKAGAGPLTLLIMMLCSAIFASAFIGLGNSVYGVLSFYQDLGSANFTEFWRFFTPSLLHFSLLHLLGNLIWWWLIGGLIERRLGSKELLMLLLAAGVVPCILQYLLEGPNFGGLSGVVYGLFGYVWVLGRMAPQLGITIPNSYLMFMIGWMLLGFMEVLGLNMANYAHLGGLLVGVLQGWLRANRAGT
ncbi:rhomboid family intramembrane serine protease GlpG [Paraferrimonas sp. SM1919]|uniref:rhomboid family intramembrane serine protease GlpG n=1 Tax=Paraferrimonas sp. SM1919 TaxID=2662263 RepID=UPI0013D5EB69|nr:rhomboid family intramembrane serine protease GlpG [Paraferrimonas sp. SM1919]